MRRAVLMAFILCLGLFARAGYDAYGPHSTPARADANAERLHALGSSAPVGVRAYLSQETDPALIRVLYQYGQISSAPDGAVGPNISAPRSRWFVEYQRAGGTAVIAGVLRKDPALVEQGLRIFQFGLDREAKNGSFPGSTWPFHGTAMFLAEAAPSLIVLTHSSFEQRFLPQIQQQIVLMHRAARRIVTAIGGPPHLDDATKNHRYFEAALALAATGDLAHDKQLQTWSRAYARGGMRMERANGVMPEDSGHDSGYQALGLTYAIRFLSLETGQPLYRPLYASVQRAEAWELSRVHAGGTVNQSGDTRTVGCRERDPAGQCKTTFYAPIFNALTRWAIVAHQTEYERAALKVWLVNWASQPGDVLPPPGLYAQPNQVHAGQWLTVWGTRFQPLEVVRVYFDGRFIQQIPCDQIGSFGGHSPQPNAHFPLPRVEAGTYTVEARGSLGTVRRLRIAVVG